MVNLFEVCINVIEMTMTLMFLTLYFKPKYYGLKSVLGFLVWLCVSAGTITVLNSIYLYEAFLGLVFILIYFLYSHTCLKGNIYIKLFISGFLNSTMDIIALFSTLCFSVVFNLDNSKLYSNTNERIALVIFGKILLAAVCGIILKYRFNDNIIVKKRNTVILIIMPIIAEISIVGIMQVFLKHNELRNELLLSSVSVMFANILTYYMFIKINTEIRLETEFNIMKHSYENERIHAKDMEELYAKTYGLRHDLIIHFSTISNLMEDNPEKAKQYIENVTNHQLEEIKHFVKTDNECFDAIVNAKIAVCDKLGIAVQTRIMERSLKRLQNDEIAIIFGNLFENAIDAAKISQKKRIQLDVQIQGAYLSILMRNSIDKSVLENNSGLTTTKEDKYSHGYGIKNIRRIVEHYNGMINYYEENGYFCCDILVL